MSRHRHNRYIWIACLTASALLLLASIFFLSRAGVYPAAAQVITTSVTIKICGNANVETGEFCDDGILNGQYATSTAGRHCNLDCTGFAAYCGDAILQQVQAETCDDGNNTSGDRCSAACQIEELPSGPPPGGGGSGNNSPGSFTELPETRIVILGKAYPNSKVNLLKDGEIIATVNADASASFSYGTNSVTPGVATFGFWAQDRNSLKSAVVATTFSIVANALTTISGIYIPPTLSLAKKTVNKGELLQVSGQTVPRVTVRVQIDADAKSVKEVTADDTGVWNAGLETSVLLDESAHDVRAQLKTTDENNLEVRSGFSQSVSFYVGKRGVTSQFLADLNNDGKVNLVDFSVLLFYFGSGGPVGDLNNDSRVNIADFSILLFNWTG